MHHYSLKIFGRSSLLYDPLSVSAKFCLLFTGIHFYLAFQAFRFLGPVKGLTIRLRPPDIF